MIRSLFNWANSIYNLTILLCTCSLQLFGPILVFCYFFQEEFLLETSPLARLLHTVYHQPCPDANVAPTIRYTDTSKKKMNSDLFPVRTVLSTWVLKPAKVNCHIPSENHGQRTRTLKWRPFITCKINTEIESAPVINILDIWSQAMDGEEHW